MIIAGWAMQCRLGFIYLRGEFVWLIDKLEAAIQQARDAGYLGKDILGTGWDFDLLTYRGAGAYICGEETALLNSLEGRRGEPRVKPPFPAQVGAYGKPTTVNNVETLAAVPAILRMGGAQYAMLGTPGNTGTRIFCLSGHVKRPGLYELPLGLPLDFIMNDLAGGSSTGRRIKAVIPGGVQRPDLRRPGLRLPHGLRHGEGPGLHGRLRRHHRHGRGHLHGGGDPAPDPVLRPRELRPVHPLPGGLQLDGDDPVPHRARPGAPGRPGPAGQPDAAASTCAPCAPWGTRRAGRWTRPSRNSATSSSTTSPWGTAWPGEILGA